MVLINIWVQISDLFIYLRNIINKETLKVLDLYTYLNDILMEGGDVPNFNFKNILQHARGLNFIIFVVPKLHLKCFITINPGFYRNFNFFVP